MKKLMIMTVAAMALGLSAVAATSFAYQGVLRDELGKPLSAEQATITFRLYNAASDGDKLWEKSLNLAIDTNGLFNAELKGDGLAEAIADAEEKGQTLYVGLTVKDSAGEITPRQKMIATPLAAYAQNVAKADKDFTVTGTAYFKGAVSMETSNTVFNAKNVSASETLDVAGKTTLRNGAEIQGEVNVANSLKVNNVYMSMPIGSIIMWSGASNELPKDGCWALCDGKTTYPFNGNKDDVRTVPDLSGRFIVGVGTSTSGTNYVAGATGGEEFHKLTVDEMASHRHIYVSLWNLSERYEGELSKYASKVSELDEHFYSSDGQSGLSGYSGVYQGEAVGGDKPHENRPPYYALCYIIKIK